MKKNSYCMLSKYQYKKSGNDLKELQSLSCYGGKIAKPES